MHVQKQNYVIVWQSQDRRIIYHGTIQNRRVSTSFVIILGLILILVKTSIVKPYQASLQTDCTESSESTAVCISRKQYDWTLLVNTTQCGTSIIIYCRFISEKKLKI